MDVCPQAGGPRVYVVLSDVKGRESVRAMGALRQAMVTTCGAGQLNLHGRVWQEVNAACAEVRRGLVRHQSFRRLPVRPPLHP